MKEKVAGISIWVNVALAGGKIAAGAVSGSAAVLADGIHSLMDVFSSAVSYAGIKMSLKPADQEHPYGHYKFEVLAGMMITLILLLTGAGIIYEAYRGFLNPEEIRIGYFALIVMGLSAVANEVMARVKIHYGQRESSISLLSDGFHSRIDVYASAAVFGGLLLAKYWIYADSLMAFLIGAYIVLESFSLGREAADSLLDVSAGAEIEEKIKSIAQTEKIEIYSLKTQKKGSAVTANLEIQLPSGLTVEKATGISRNLRKKLIAGIDKLQYVSIQIISHEMEVGFYQPSFGKGFGWQRKGRFVGEINQAHGGGPGGSCVCPKCGYKVAHERGIPCSSLICPKCKIKLIRKIYDQAKKN